MDEGGINDDSENFPVTVQRESLLCIIIWNVQSNKKLTVLVSGLCATWPDGLEHKVAKSALLILKWIWWNRALRWTCQCTCHFDWCELLPRDLGQPHSPNRLIAGRRSEAELMFGSGDSVHMWHGEAGCLATSFTSRLGPFFLLTISQKVISTVLECWR